jgi:hypothetical protein
MLRSRPLLQLPDPTCRPLTTESFLFLLNLCLVDAATETHSTLPVALLVPKADQPISAHTTLYDNVVMLV